MKKLIVFFICCIFYQMVFPETVFKDLVVGRLFQVDSGGNMYTNEGEHSISKYSPSGEFILRMGQKGEGPGDIKRLEWFAIDPVDNTILVTEYIGGNKWISKFSKHGKYLGMWNCDLDLHKWKGLHKIAITKNAVYLEAHNSINRKVKSFQVGEGQATLFKFSRDGKNKKLIHEHRADNNAWMRGKGNITIPFQEYLYWVPIGKSIVVVESHKNYMIVKDEMGKKIRKITLPFELKKLTALDIDEWEKDMKSYPDVLDSIKKGFLDLDYWKSNLPFPRHKPIVSSMIGNSGNTFYVKKFSGYQSKKEVWIYMDAEGKRQQILASKGGEKILSIKGNDVYIRRYNQEEDDTLVVKCSKDNIFSKGALDEK